MFYYFGLVPCRSNVIFMVNAHRGIFFSLSSFSVCVWDWKGLCYACMICLSLLNYENQVELQVSHPLFSEVLGLEVDCRCC